MKKKKNLHEYPGYLYTWYWLSECLSCFKKPFHRPARYPRPSCHRRFHHSTKSLFAPSATLMELVSKAKEKPQGGTAWKPLQTMPGWIMTTQTAGAMSFCCRTFYGPECGDEKVAEAIERLDALAKDWANPDATGYREGKRKRPSTLHPTICCGPATTTS